MSVPVAISEMFLIGTCVAYWCSPRLVHGLNRLFLFHNHRDAGELWHSGSPEYFWKFKRFALPKNCSKPLLLLVTSIGPLKHLTVFQYVVEHLCFKNLALIWIQKYLLFILKPSVLVHLAVVLDEQEFVGPTHEWFCVCSTENLFCFHKEHPRRTKAKREVEIRWSWSAILGMYS